MCAINHQALAARQHRKRTASPDPNNTGAFTVASENPVYVMGNYNANDAGFGNAHASAAVIADAVTLLSKSWDDKNSFNSPTNAAGRPATSSNYRMAVCAGKNQNFSRASVAGAPSSDFGALQLGLVATKEGGLS